MRPFDHTVKWRNQLLALGCLIAFAGLGVLYFQHWVIQKPFGIVLFIGEGLSAERIAAARVFAGGAENPLALDALPHTALVTNYSKDFATPDTAAAATALATGLKVSNRALAGDTAAKTLTTLLDLARDSGRATGLVTDGRLTHATTAAFFRHDAQPTDPQSIARELVEHGKVDIVLGGGSADFVAREKGGQRNDARDLLLELRRNGSDVVRTKTELELVPAWRRAHVFGVFSNAELAFSDEIEPRNTQPGLAEMVRRAIELLQYNRAGYLLVVDANLMRKAAEENDGERTLNETVELDRAVAVATRYVGANSMVVVCGDVAIGGLSMNGAPFLHDRGIAVLGLNSSGDPWLTWASGPKGVKSYGAASLNEPAPAAPSASPDDIVHPPQEPAAFYANTALNTVSDVVAFGSGDGTAALQGTIDNTTIFRLIRAKL